jgi:hypothetical protein
MNTFWESVEAIRAFTGDDICVAKVYAFDKEFLLELEPCSTLTLRDVTTAKPVGLSF